MFFVQAHVMDFSNFKHTASASTSVAASPMKGERAMPPLMTMARWSADVSPDAVLLSPSDLRQAWQEFLTVRPHYLCDCVLACGFALCCTITFCVVYFRLV